jgi:hypothetical protein
MAKSDKIEALRTQPWQSLFDVPTGPVVLPTARRRASGDVLPTGAVSPPPASMPVEAPLSIREHTLAVDLVNSLDSSFNERMQRCSFSARHMEEAAQGLLNKGMAQQVWLGKLRMLAPTGKLYGLLGSASPYGDSEWNMHTFLIRLGARIYERNPLVKFVRLTVPLDGPHPAVIDLVADLKDGNRLAVEVIHHCVTNVAGHAAKLIEKNFAQLIFLCTDFDQKERVRAVIRNCGFDADFLATIRYQIFGALLRQNKKELLKDVP